MWWDASSGCSCSQVFVSTHDMVTFLIGCFRSSVHCVVNVNIDIDVRSAAGVARGVACRLSQPSRCITRSIRKLLH